ncbi:hypothetical protein BDV93DRAFT_514852 [Ceratobasidium sp. AG-I]|nr:hypothetical protein BDV93DRAFT_514852 [Ceratobasidium sp. AG-I]
MTHEKQNTVHNCDQALIMKAWPTGRLRTEGHGTWDNILSSMSWRDGELSSTTEWRLLGNRGQAQSSLPKEEDCRVWIEGWLDKLVVAAQSSGATFEECALPVSPYTAKSTDEAQAGASKTAPLKVYLEQSTERAKTIEAKREVRIAAKKAKEIQAKIEKTEQERLRKAAYRERVVAREIETGVQDADGKLAPAGSKLDVDVDVLDGDIASAAICLTITGCSGKEDSQQRSQRKSSKALTKCWTCWRGFALWIHILAAVKATRFEYTKKLPTAVIKQLQNTHRATKLFNIHHESTLGQ